MTVTIVYMKKLEEAQMITVTLQGYRKEHNLCLIGLV